LNSGPGSVGALFVHENHFDKKDFNKLDGWWGHDLKSRFEMNNKMIYANGASSFALYEIYFTFFLLDTKCFY
jgi:kynureninase